MHCRKVVSILGVLIIAAIQARATATPAGNAACNVRDFGATGQPQMDATEAFRKAVDTCAKRGGGTIYVGPGAYTSGPIELKDNIGLYVDAGATISVSSDAKDFEGRPNSLIYSDGARNISISGKGTLDGKAQYRWGISEDKDPEIDLEKTLAQRAGQDMRRSIRVGRVSHILWLQNSTNVHIDDISIINSSEWSVRLDDCARVFVHGAYISSSLAMGVNADGIDLVSSRDVTISDSIVSTGDDAIVLKTMPVKGVLKPVENVTVTNCILTSSSTPLMIGTETYADIRHIIFSNIVIRDSNKGFGINVQDGATVSDVLVSNITMELNRRHWNWWGSAEAFKIVLKKRDASSRVGTIKNIDIDNIVSHSRGTSLLQGLPEKPLENIRLSRLQLFMEPEDAVDKRASDALQFEWAKGLWLHDVDVSWSESHSEKNWRSALALKKVSDFSIDDFAGRQAQQDGAPAIRIDQSIGGEIRNSRAKEGCKVFVELRGHESANVRLADNDVSKAATPIAFSGGAVQGSAVCTRCE